MEPIRVVNDLPVYLDQEDGRFFATLPGGVDIRRASLKELEKEIMKRSPGVPVMVVYSPGHIAREEVVGFRSSAWMTAAGVSTGFGEVLLFDAEAWDRFQDLREEYRQLDQRWYQLKRSQTPFTRGHFPQRQFN